MNAEIAVLKNKLDTMHAECDGLTEDAIAVDVENIVFFQKTLEQDAEIMKLRHTTSTSENILELKDNLHEINSEYRKQVELNSTLRRILNNTKDELENANIKNSFLLGDNTNEHKLINELTNLRKRDEAYTTFMKKYSITSRPYEEVELKKQNMFSKAGVGFDRIPIDKKVSKLKTVNPTKPVMNGKSGKKPLCYHV